MKRFASHYLFLPGYGYLKQYVVEVEQLLLHYMTHKELKLHLLEQVNVEAVNLEVHLGMKHLI